jgi:type II secretory pathway pseudopilin PulG
MQILIMLAIVAVAVVLVYRSRRNRDRAELAARVRSRGGEVIRLVRVRKGSPFPDTGRGWWAWRVEWRDGAGAHVSWALTTRDGIQSWQDER